METHPIKESIKKTYNPIKEPFKVERTIIGRRHRAPVGFTYVLFGHDGESIVVEQGCRLRRRDGLFGGYTEGFKVDVRKTRLEKTVELPCLGDAHHFAASFGMTCWVTDARAVVRDAIQDAGAVLWSAVIRYAREVSRQHRLDETAVAERMITDRLAGVVLHPAFQTQPLDVSLSSDKQAVEIYRRRTDIAVWTNFFENPVVAAHIAHHPGDIRGALEVFDEQRRQHEEVSRSFNSGREGAKKELRERSERQMGICRNGSAVGVRPILPPQELPVNSDGDKEDEGKGDLA